MTTSFSFSSRDQKSSSIPWSSRSRSRFFWFVSPEAARSSRALSGCSCCCCCCCCFLQSSSSSRRSGASVRRVWRWCASSVLARSLDASWSLRSFWSSSSSSSFSIDTQSSSRAVLIFSKTFSAASFSHLATALISSLVNSHLSAALLSTFAFNVSQFSIFPLKLFLTG